MNTEEIQALHAKVWAFRRELADVWPTPDTLDSLRFAFTEAGEAMDAYLRTKGGYARNHVKEPDLYGELADCALMLFTALGETATVTKVHIFDLDIDWLIATVADVYAVFTDDGDIPPYLMDQALSAIAAYPGMDLAAELDKRLARIKAKHGKG